MSVIASKGRKPSHSKFLRVVSLCVVCSLSILLRWRNATTRKQNLFIGYAVGYPLEVIFRVSSSFHSVTGASASLVLFSDIDSTGRSYLEAKFRRLTVVGTVHTGKSIDSDISYTDQQFTNHAFQRYLIIHAWLSLHSKQFKHIIMSDIRDIAFFGDPFRQLKKSEITPGVQVFTEILRYKDDAKWNQKWIRNCYGQAFLDTILVEYITCCGVIAGTSESLLEYLNAFVEELSRKRGCDETGLDTAIHVWIIHRRLKNTKIIDSETALIRHAPNETGIRLNPRGQPINHLGEPYALIHQADRLTPLWERFCAQHALDLVSNV